MSETELKIVNGRTSGKRRVYGRRKDSGEWEVIAEYPLMIHRDIHTPVEHSFLWFKWTTTKKEIFDTWHSRDIASKTANAAIASGDYQDVELRYTHVNSYWWTEWRNGKWIDAECAGRSDLGD